MLQRILYSVTLLATLMITPLSAADPKPDTAVFMNSLPQSIEYYITLGLMRYYRLTGFIASDKTFPMDTIRVPSIERLAKFPQSYINNAYVPPTQKNIDLLTANLGKMILHVRDPRDALVSWVAYTELQWTHPGTLALINPVPPKEYARWTYEQKVDWQIDHYYTYAMSWLNQWAAFLDANPHLQVLVTKFEDMAVDPLQTFREVIAFYGTDPSLITEKDILPLTREQFRATVADIGQWKVKLTAAQQKRVTDMLNEKTASFFNWNK